MNIRLIIWLVCTGLSITGCASTSHTNRHDNMTREVAAYLLVAPKPTPTFTYIDRYDVVYKHGGKLGGYNQRTNTVYVYKDGHVLYIEYHEIAHQHTKDEDVAHRVAKHFAGKYKP